MLTNVTDGYTFNFRLSNQVNHESCIMQLSWEGETVATTSYSCSTSVVTKAATCDKTVQFKNQILNQNGKFN